MLEWQKRGVSIIAWTVNSPQDKEHFCSVLQIPFMTDLTEDDEVLANEN